MLLTDQKYSPELRDFEHVRLRMNGCVALLSELGNLNNGPTMSLVAFIKRTAAVTIYGVYETAENAIHADRQA